MKLLGIDPSSTRTGWALLTDSGELLDAGYSTGRRSKDAAPTRIKAMAFDIKELVVGKVDLSEVIVEIPGSRVHANSRSRGNGLSVYGTAAGAVWMAAEFSARAGTSVIYVLETEWTRRIPKADRKIELVKRYPEYRSIEARDGGGDIADAIGLVLWRLGELRKKAAMAGAKSVV